MGVMNCRIRAMRLPHCTGPRTGAPHGLNVWFPRLVYDLDAKRLRADSALSWCYLQMKFTKRAWDITSAGRGMQIPGYCHARSIACMCDKYGNGNLKLRSKEHNGMVAEVYGICRRLADNRTASLPEPGRTMGRAAIRVCALLVGWFLGLSMPGWYADCMSRTICRHRGRTPCVWRRGVDRDAANLLAVYRTEYGGRYALTSTPDPRQIGRAGMDGSILAYLWDVNAHAGKPGIRGIRVHLCVVSDLFSHAGTCLFYGFEIKIRCCYDVATKRALGIDQACGILDGLECYHVLEYGTAFAAAYRYGHVLWMRGLIFTTFVSAGRAHRTRILGLQPPREDPPAWQCLT